MHIPWRSEILLKGTSTWEDLYKTIQSFPYMLSLNFTPDDMKHVEPADLGHFMDENDIQPDKEIDDMLEAIKHDHKSYGDMCIEHGFKNFPDYDWAKSSQLVTNTSVEEFNKKLKNSTKADRLPVDMSKFNWQQQEIYDYIVSHDNMQTDQQLFLLVQGASGTGKSFLIGALQDHFKQKLMSCAPTGCASFLINGETIHSLFAINGAVFTKIASKTAISLAENKFKNTKYLIIDEFSMLGLSLLGKIDTRCREILSQNSNKFFGGLSVIMFGDINQLPPVKDEPLYSNRIKDELAVNGKKAFSLFKIVPFSHRKCANKMTHDLADF